jgi:hypothetical protein
MDPGMLKERTAQTGAAPAQILSMRRESSITTLAAAGALDASQVAAAFRFRNAYLITLEAKRESIGFDEWRAPGRTDLNEQERRADAARDLSEARRLVGAYAYALLLRVAGEGHSLSDMYGARRARESHADILKIHLGMLANLWRNPQKR